MTFQDVAAHEHVHDLCAHVRSESPKTLGLTNGQAETRHFLKLGADTDDGRVPDALSCSNSGD